MSHIKNRLNEEGINFQGYNMIIVGYRNNKDIDVMFCDEFKTTVLNKNYKNFKLGKIKNPNHPSLYGIGFLGQGSYNAKDHAHIYEHWANMIARCYSSNNVRHNCYIECTVAKIWHNFQNFAKWFEENTKDLRVTTFSLDKDILIKHNKIYSPKNCLIVNNRINSIFVKQVCLSGLPIGVYHCGSNKFYARFTKNKKTVPLGTFNTPEEAFYAYKEAKEAYIKEVADEEFALGNITKECRDALYAYKVEITD